VGEGERLFEVADWQELQQAFLSQLSILKELNDNGSAEFTNNTCEVECIHIVQLNEIDKQILGLPNAYPCEIYVESDGVLTQSNFKFKYGFYDFCPNGTMFNVLRCGPVLYIAEREYLLSENQYHLCKAIDEFNKLPEEERGNVKNLLKLSELKTLSRESGLVLEQFLNKQELFVPDKIKLGIDFTNGALEIFPALEIENAAGFLNTFDRLPTVRDVYPVSGNYGETTRVVISEEQKRELVKLKLQRKITDHHLIQQIVEHPELYFDEEQIDFTIFYSDRVKEIGIYNPKFYPFASPYKSQWIPGIVVKDRVHGAKKIQFRSYEVLSDFIEQKEIAVKQKKQNVHWENVEIPIEEAEQFIATAKKQFENPNTPVVKESKANTEVLIIKENAEITEFTNGTQFQADLTHSFFGINNLASGIHLKEHQMEGVSWLQSLLKENFSGGLLADDMGLGKTLQLLYFIEWHSQHYKNNKPYLIVAPVSLLENWENEYNKFFNPQNLPLCRLYGSVSLTKENNPPKNYEDAKGLQFKQIILTNYETVRAYQISLGLVDFAVVSLDEAQKIKTPGTLITNASKALKADFKIAMTGTPVENTLVDIWCLMDFAVPGLLGNAKDFAKEYQKPLSDENTDVRELTERLRNNIGVFIKRRLKSDVAKDLPVKHDNTRSRIKRVMPSVQLERYRQEIQMANDTELEGVEKRNQKLKSLWAVRDISDHPYLAEKQILQFSTEELISTSSKLQTTIGILADIQSKQEKAILFADRRETQKMLQKVLYDMFGVLASIINGDTPTSSKAEGKTKFSRQQTIDRFQSEPGFNVIIMSPIAAGVGLNVTEANHVIHYSRHWNPAKEEQATDRAYRIGQQKDVFVYYPMAVFPDDMKDEKGNKLKSFDEILDTLLNNKKALASNTLFPTEQAEITLEELFGNVFSSQTENTSKPLSIAEIDRFHPNLFEASIAALYKKQGFEIYLTPYSNDKGADLVVLKNGENYLIQIKQSRSIVSNDAIQEICTAKKYYENKFRENFGLVAITNNDFSPSAMLLAKANSVILKNRAQLDYMLTSTNINIQDITKLESQRMTNV
jgi:HJR/Mrr/RecB family endonuclease